MLYGNTPSDSSVDLDRISQAYDRLLESHYPKLAHFEHASDWHLRLVWLPDDKPEVIYSVSCLGDTARITLVRFLESAWRRFSRAYSSGEDKVSVPVEIGKMDLPSDHSIHHIVTEGIPRACEDDPTPQHHGEEFRLFYQNRSRTHESCIWEPYQKEVESWNDLIDSVRGAGTLVPRRFVAE